MAAASRKFLKTFCTATAVCAVLVCAGYAGVYNYIEKHCYQPVMSSYLNEQTQTVAQEVSSYTDRQIALFTLFSGNNTIRRSVETTQAAEDVIERGTLAETLLAETPGLQGIRIIDKNCKHIYYSTFPADFAGRKEHIVSYIDYPSSDPDFELISAEEEIGSRITLDSNKNVLIFAYPFYDTAIEYKGTIAFYVDPKPMQQYILAAHFKSGRPNVQLINSYDESKPHGIVFGLPKIEEGSFADQIISLWQTPHSSGYIEDTEHNTSLFLCFAETETTGFVAKAYPKTVLELPKNLKTLFSAAICILGYIIALIVYASKNRSVPKQSKQKEASITAMQEKLLASSPIPYTSLETEELPEIELDFPQDLTVLESNTEEQTPPKPLQNLVRIVEDTKHQDTSTPLEELQSKSELATSTEPHAAPSAASAQQASNTASSPNDESTVPRKVPQATETLRQLALHLQQETPHTTDQSETNAQAPASTPSVASAQQEPNAHAEQQAASSTTSIPQAPDTVSAPNAASALQVPNAHAEPHVVSSVASAQQEPNAHAEPQAASSTTSIPQAPDTVSAPNVASAQQAQTAHTEPHAASNTASTQQHNETEEHKNGGLLHKSAEYIERAHLPDENSIQVESPLHSMTLPGYKDNYFSLIKVKNAASDITTIEELDDIEQIQLVSSDQTEESSQQKHKEGTKTMYANSAALAFPITDEPVQELIPLEEPELGANISSIFAFHTNNSMPRFQVQAEEKQQENNNTIFVEEDGVYKISNAASQKPARINYEFKRLVDSVLNG